MILEKECKTCHFIFSKSSTCSLKRWNEERKYCSKKCSQTIFKKGITPWNKGIENKEMQGDKHPMFGKHHSEETKKKISTNRRGKASGENNSNWKNGKTNLLQLLRSKAEYKDWRKAIFERDSYTCQHCNKRGGELNADHIKPFAYFPELRLDINNGRTLCINCHRQTDTYGNRNKPNINNL